METETLFGSSGNFADYWLDASQNSFLRDGAGWLPAELVIRVLRKREIEKWNAETGAGDDELNDDAAEAWMRNEFERGGGLQGGTPELSFMRSKLVAIGSWEAAMESRRERRRNR